MIMDFIVLAVFIFGIFLSMRKGFALTIINFFKCIVSLVLGWMFCDEVRDFLLEKTPLGTLLTEKVIGALSSKWETSQIYQALPDLFKSKGGNFSNSIINDGAQQITMIILTIISFFLIVVGVSLIAGILKRIFSKKYNHGFAGFIDWILGMILGIFVGAFYVFLFLALILPVVGIFVPSLYDVVMNGIDSSYIAKDLYDNNILLIIFRDFLG